MHIHRIKKNGIDEPICREKIGTEWACGPKGEGEGGMN